MKRSSMVFFITLCFLSLTGCSSAPEKTVESSEARDLMDLYQLNVNLYVQDGVTPEKAKVGVDKNLLKAERSISVGKHALNYAIGGLGGIFSFGILQSQSNVNYNQAKEILDNPTIFIYKPESDNRVEESIDFLKDSLNEFGYSIHQKEKYGTNFIIGNDCVLEKENCALRLHHHNYFSERTFIPSFKKPFYYEFPEAFKPRIEVSEKYKISSWSIRKYKNIFHDGKKKLVIADISEVMKILHKKLNEHPGFEQRTYLLYLPSYMNNGQAAIIDPKGKNNYFVN